jgi:DNA-binding SARP family transcriptional activator/DNA-binding XRE family transcriptional regulator
MRSNESVGVVLRDHRCRAGLTQQQLASAAGLSLAAVRDLEQGRCRRPRATSVAALAAALSMSDGERDFLSTLAKGTDDVPGRGGVRVSVLGPLAVSRGGHTVAAGGEPRKALLAILALSANHVVAREDLIDVLWPGKPPVHAVRLLQTHVARLRRTLEVGGLDTLRVRSVPGGYRLDATSADLDVLEFRDHVAHARRTPATEPGHAIAALERALRLWRGEPLTNVLVIADRPELASLTAERIAATVRYADLTVAGGAPERALHVLRELAGRHPLHEALHARLIRAIALSGDQAGALRWYEKIRTGLADELGIDPGSELRDLHRRLLRQEELGPAGADAAVKAPRAVRPLCLLPADTTDYVGHADELRTARDALGDPDRVPAVIVVEGPAGVGKTTFVVHVAHQLRDAYPDGQLFMDLGGGRAGPVDPADALSRLLRVVGAGDHARSGRADLADLTTRYRMMLEGRRFLVVLDDAASAQQVRPFLTGRPGCAVLVSTRARLTALPGVRRIELNMLNTDEATDLIVAAIGADRVAAEREAGATLVEACAGLPLALRIVGARLAARPHWRLSTLVDRLADERRHLDELAFDDLEVRASLAISYHGLDQETQRCFRTIGFYDLAEFATWTVAALLEVSADVADELIDNLVEARLVAVADSAAAISRYRMHRLVRLYGRELAATVDDAADLGAAVERALTTTSRLIEQFSERVLYAMPGLARHGATGRTLSRDLAVPVIDDRKEWLATEEAALIAAVERASALGLTDMACQLADGLVFARFALSNNFTGWGRAHTAALTVARASGDRAAEAVLLCGLGHLRFNQDRFTDAITQFTIALDLFGQAGYHRGEAAALFGLGTAHREIGDHHLAIPALERAREVFDRLGDQEGVAHTAYGLGYCFRELGDDDRALELLNSAATRYQELGHFRGLVTAIRGLGLVHRATGELVDAERYCAQAHQLALDLGDRHLQCYTAQALAKTWIRGPDPHRAHEPLAKALRICCEVDDRFGAALVERTIGELHLALGNCHAAIRHLREAQTRWENINHPLARARTLRDLGAANLHLDDHPTAHRAWRDALTTFQHLGTREAGELTTWRARQGCHCATLT